MQRMLPTPVIGALAGIGIITTVFTLTAATPKKVTTDSAKSSVSSKAAGTPTSAPASPSTATPVAVADPAPPAAPTANGCSLAAPYSSGSGGSTTDIFVPLKSDVAASALVDAVPATPWGSSLNALFHDGAVHVSAPPTFRSADFALAEAWFRANGEVTDVVRSPKPAIGLIVCLTDIADPARLPEVLSDFVKAKSVAGYRFTLSGTSAEVWLARSDGLEPIWGNLQAGLGALGTISSASQYDTWT
jgi:hypothetical protein